VGFPAAVCTEHQTQVFGLGDVVLVVTCDDEVSRPRLPPEGKDDDVTLVWIDNKSVVCKELTRKLYESLKPFVRWRDEQHVICVK
jgi:hypothetical protein